MTAVDDEIIAAYSQLADKYDEPENLESCWGRAAETALQSLRISHAYHTVVDVGCGTARGLLRLAADASPATRFIGLEPAREMRVLAEHRTSGASNIIIRDGRFENTGLDSSSIDYLYSIYAFHWTTDVPASIAELARVMKPNGNMDLFFIGRNNGKEFIQATTPIFLRYMGPALLLKSARMRKQLTTQEAAERFSAVFEGRRVAVEESYQTYHDTLDRHWGWWLRIEGHFLMLPERTREDCYKEVRHALSALCRESGIPYTIHQLHVSVRD
jgi:ubiquinone/menaquinone biosynthesis C-methylase UbiE